jgi:UDP-2,3-diacylglucosamine pyrophosphatase LpxH
MRTKKHRLRLAAAWLVLLAMPATAAPESFRFVILGDRTGETQPGVYEQVWKEAAAVDPAFVVTVGDTIQGLQDATAESEWQSVEQILMPYRRYPLYLVPGNHDIWSEISERLFRKYARHDPHYSFDYRQAHFTILDNSRSDTLSQEELTFLEKDLREHEAQPVKFIVSHRPSWLTNVILRNPDFPVHQLAKKYGVRTVIAGHVHEMLHVDLDGVRYISMASAGGHLRATKKYEDGWFFGYALVDVSGADARFQIKELKPPKGQGRVTGLADWGVAGLVKRSSGAPLCYFLPLLRR